MVKHLDAESSRDVQLSVLDVQLQHGVFQNRRHGGPVDARRRRLVPAAAAVVADGAAPGGRRRHQRAVGRLPTETSEKLS